MSISLNPFSRCFRTQPEPTPLDLALPLLQSAGLDTPANRQRIQSESSQKVIESLAASNLLTQPNIDKLLLGASDCLVARALSELVAPGRPVPVPVVISQREIDTIFPNPESVPDSCMALHYLHKTYLTKPINFDIFSLGGDVAVGLGLLESRGLLTERNLDAVIAYPWMGTAFSDTMAEWDSTGMLTQQQLDAFLNTEDLDTDLNPLIQDCCANLVQGRGASVEHRQCAIRLMREIRILTPENRMDILAHPDRALFTVMMYDWLDWGDILSPANKDVVLNQLKIADLEYIAGSGMVALKICVDPTQFTTQDIFDRLVEKPRVAIQVLPAFAILVNAQLFTPAIVADVFSLDNIESWALGVIALQEQNLLNGDNLAELMANPNDASEVSIQMICGLDRSSREQIARGDITPELLAQPGCIELKEHLARLLGSLGIASSENLKTVSAMKLQDVPGVIIGLVALQQGLIFHRRNEALASIPSLLPSEVDEMESFMQKGFKAIVQHPKQAFQIAQLHLALQAKIPPQQHEACFAHLENLSNILQGVELLGKNGLVNPENLMAFLSDDQAHVAKIAALLSKCRSLDQPGFERIVASVKSGEVTSAQSLGLDVGLRRRLPLQGHEMKV